MFIYNIHTCMYTIYCKLQSCIFFLLLLYCISYLLSGVFSSFTVLHRGRNIIIMTILLKEKKITCIFTSRTLHYFSYRTFTHYIIVFLHFIITCEILPSLHLPLKQHVTQIVKHLPYFTCLHPSDTVELESLRGEQLLSNWQLASSGSHPWTQRDTKDIRVAQI